MPRLIKKGKVGRRALPLFLAGVVLGVAVTAWQSMLMASRVMTTETETTAMTSATHSRGVSLADESSSSAMALSSRTTLLLSSTSAPRRREDSAIHSFSDNQHETLALLYPPGLMGGYRNQVLRFVAFCVHAQTNNIRQLLLPSLWWSTQVTTTGSSTENSAVNTKSYPIPMEWVFDIEHWNEHAKESHVLPLLVDDHQVHTEDNPSDCWEPPPSADSKQQVLQQLLVELNVSQSLLNPLQLAVLQSGSLSPIANITRATVTGAWTNMSNARSIDLLPLVQHCQKPHVFGGGTKAGRLWNAYVRFRTRAENQNKKTAAVSTAVSNKTGKTSLLDPASIVPYQMDQAVYRALRPSKQWRQVAQQCVQAHAPNQRYIALHARVELEMMEHRCGQTMEWNLERIVQQVQDLVQLQQQEETETTASTTISGLFVAVSRSGMEVQSPSQEKFRALANRNLATLNLLVGNETTKGTGMQINRDTTIPVFECGERILQEYYASHPNVPDHGSLLQSVINFDIAVNAHVFVGVENSSYSTDVMTTRYYLGKGKQNFRYSTDGKVQAVENGGLPLPHSNCRRTARGIP